MNIRYLSLFMALISTVQAQEINYKIERSFAMGDINYVNPYGGEYVYGQGNIKDERIQHSVITLQEIDRDYEYFSPEEEKLLSEAIDKKVAKAFKRHVERQRRSYRAAMAKVDWPKISLVDGKYCFPKLSNDLSDWMSGEIYCVEAGHE